MSADSTLLNLQECDTYVGALRDHLEALPESRARIEADTKLTQLSASYDDLHTERSAAEREVTKLDDQAETLGDKIARERDKLFGGQVSSPRELAAIQSEIEMLERRKSEIEESELAQMLTLDESQETFDSLSESKSQTAIEVQECAQKEESAKAQLGAELHTLEAQRVALAAAVAPDLLIKYDTTLSRFGVGAAAFSKGVCQSCHMKLSPAEVEDLHQEKLPICPNCEAIAVFDES